MGLGGISIWQLLVVLAIVALLFGTKRLRGVGGDVGDALKDFRQAVKDDGRHQAEAAEASQTEAGESNDKAA